MNELDRIEATALSSAVALGGGRSELVGGAFCFTQPRLPIVELNRALPAEADVDLDAVAAWFAGPHTVSTNDDVLQRRLEQHGYERARAWMKFERDAAPADTGASSLDVRETTDAELFARVAAEGSGIPPEERPTLAALVGAPGWSCFVAWAGDEPAGSGVLYVDGTAAWIGVGSTRPDFRRRGAQTALLAQRIEAARALGVRLLVTETGVRVAGGSSSSYDNILRAGFREAYVRPNWRSPD